MDTHLRMASPQSVAAPAQRQPTRWSLGFLARNRYQLLGAAIVAVVLPALVVGAEQLEGTVIASLLAVLLGAYTLRRLTAFPGVQVHACVLPVFLAAYGAMIVVLVVLQLDYSRLQLAKSFIAAVIWFHFVVHIERPVRRPRLLVLRGGNAADLLDLDGADWQFASSPDDVPSVTGVVADLRSELEPEWEKFLARCALKGLPLYHSKDIRETLTGHVAIEHLSENTLGTFLPSSLYMRFKRLLDLAGVLISAPVALPIALLTALLIKLVDGGPVLFRQTRMGFRGQPFAIYKFRTMAVTAETAGRRFTEENDPRISRLGRVLRRYRLDELPQILNIVKGEMSWIGPRPESMALADWYERHIPFYSYRHIVRPGITGWAQVNQGNVAMIKAATTKLHYDFYYIKHVSFWIELLIAARTVRIVLTGFGSR
jgi:lipopolysaccharide/colanic/teichoic acid biosynthesis glycosyltransferase